MEDPAKKIVDSLKTNADRAEFWKRVTYHMNCRGFTAADFLKMASEVIHGEWQPPKAAPKGNGGVLRQMSVRAEGTVS